MVSERDYQDLLVTEAQAGSRVDRFLVASLKDIARNRVQQMIKKELVLVNELPVKVNYILKTMDRIRIFEENEKVGPYAEEIPINVLFEDKDIVVIDKPAGMLVHGNHYRESGTLVNALLYKYGYMADEAEKGRPGIVHRLDKNTSGVMVVARTNEAYHGLVNAFKSRQIDKVYLGICVGSPLHANGEISLGIERSGSLSIMKTVTDGGKQSLTYYEVLEKFAEYTLVKCMPKTGRTHQIRVHLKAINCPLICDEVYGRDFQKFCVMRSDEQSGRKKKCLLDRHGLHAYQIAFNHPMTGEKMKFQAPLAFDMEQVLSALRTGEKRV